MITKWLLQHGPNQITACNLLIGTTTFGSFGGNFQEGRAMELLKPLIHRSSVDKIICNCKIVNANFIFY